MRRAIGCWFTRGSGGHRKGGTRNSRRVPMSSVPCKLVEDDTRSIFSALGLGTGAERSVDGVRVLPRTSPLRPHDRGDAGRASSRATNERRRPIPSLPSGRTIGERELVVGGPRGGVGAAPAGRGGRGAARRDGPEASWSELTIFRDLTHSPFLASEAAGLKKRRTDPGVGQSAGTRSA